MFKYIVNFKAKLYFPMFVFSSPLICLLHKNINKVHTRKYLFIPFNIKYIEMIWILKITTIRILLFIAKVRNGQSYVRNVKYQTPSLL